MNIRQLVEQEVPEIESGTICTWLSNGRECDAYIDGFNTARQKILDVLDRVKLDEEKIYALLPPQNITPLDMRAYAKAIAQTNVFKLEE